MNTLTMSKKQEHYSFLNWEKNANAKLGSGHERLNRVKATALIHEHITKSHTHTRQEMQDSSVSERATSGVIIA